MPPIGALVVGLLIVGVGLFFRFGRAPEKPKWVRVVLIIVLIPFSRSPASLIPLGLAILLYGIAIGQGSSSVVGVLAIALALLLVLVGVVFMIWTPRWLVPPSLRIKAE
jgi:hypothetical protein